MRIVNSEKHEFKMFGLYLGEVEGNSIEYGISSLDQDDKILALSIPQTGHGDFGPIPGNWEERTFRNWISDSDISAKSDPLR